MIVINTKRYEDEKFKLLGSIKDLIAYVDVYVFSSFPRSDLSQMQMYKKALYQLMDNCSLGNYNTGSIRSKYQKAMLSNIVTLDFLTGHLRDKQIIKKERFHTIVNKLNVVREKTYGWIQSNTK